LAQTIATADQQENDHRVHVAANEWNAVNYGVHPPGAPPASSLEQIVKLYVTSGLELNQPMEDALYAARMLHVFMRLSNRVPIACRTHMVNSLGAIRTDSAQAFLTASGAMMALYRNHSGTKFLKLVQQSPLYDVPEEGWTRIPYLDAVATLSQDSSHLFLHLLNLEPSQPMQVRIQIQGFDPAPAGDMWQIAPPDFLARNYFGVDNVSIDHRLLSHLAANFSQALPPHSATIIELIAK
jgi:alpha-L-arabinofuranosidase